LSETGGNLSKETPTPTDSGVLHRLSVVKVNPLVLVNSVFMIIAPFLSWITLNLFGSYESNLWQIYNNQAPLQISQTQEVASIVSGVLLIAGALIVLRSVRIGLLTQTAALLIFLIPTYSLFGYVRSGFIRFLISPGFGLILASVGLVIGFVSFRTEKVPVGAADNYLRTREGIYKAGLFIAVTAIVIDGLNHAALGQVQGFFGQNLVEAFIHFGFLLPLLFLTLAWSMWKGFRLSKWSSRIVLVAFVFLAMDAAYHYFGGTILSFLGHTSAETVLHIAVYYGFALLLISRFFMKD
jgi:hypothetical protein